MLKKRVVLWWLLIIGIICHMLFMTNINVAILSMVKKSSRRSENKTLNNEFDWNEQQQSMIYGAYFWFAGVSQLIGGVLSHKYGSKITFGLTNFIGCLLSSVIPIAAYIGWETVVVVRVIQGAIASVGLPSGIMTIIGQWSPPDERGKFTSVYLGLPLGTAIGYTIFGFIAENLGWKYVFHSTTIVGMVWYLMWQYFVFDSPYLHPRISEKERLYITKSLANSATNVEIPIPWKEILTSGPLLINILCTFGQGWAFSANIFLPKYFSSIHNLNPTMVGICTGIVFLGRALLQVSGGAVTDIMIRRGMPKTRLRNIVVFISTIIAGVFLSSIILVESSAFWSLTLLLGFNLLSSFAFSGTTTAVIDMSPNFCGVIEGMSMALSASTGFFSSLAFSCLSRYFNEPEIWGWFYLFCGLFNVVPGILFVLFSNSELQPWNTPKQYSGEIQCLLLCLSFGIRIIPLELLQQKIRYS